MRIDDVARTLGAHLALSTARARLWQRVAHGELSPEAAEVLLDGHASDELEHARRVFTPLSPEQEREQLEILLARRGEASPRAPRIRGWFGVLLLAAEAVIVQL